MCGIAGLSARFERTSERDLTDLVRTMTTALSHRGPDDSGVWCDEHRSIGFGHRRLSILDLSHDGHQPMMSRDTRWIIAFNGEIYNFKELRSRLSIERLRGSSDTEVLLEFVAEFGIDETLHSANGMFAIALWDRQEGVLTLARDRFGEKPLYYGWLGPRFVFASELAAIIAVDESRTLSIDHNSVAAFMAHSAVPSPQTVFRQIRKVPPASSVCVPLDNPGDFGVPHEYWNAVAAAHEAIASPHLGTDNEILDDLDAALRRAVGLRTIADVPLGAFLSGGIDSSLIVALMSEISNETVQTFSIGFEDDAFDESRYATSVAQHLGTQHTNLIVSDSDLLSVVPQLPNIYSEPFADSSQIPTFLVSQLARETVTVALSGDGGDEVFGGYDRYSALETLDRRVERVPRAVAKAGAHALLRVSPERYDALAARAPAGMRNRLPTGVGQKVHKGASALLTGAADAYGSIMTHWALNGGPVRDVSAEPTLAFRRGDWAQTGRAYTDAMLVDTVTYLPDDILTKVDRAAMAVSLETRIPLLDPEVFTFAWSLEQRWRRDGTNGKVALRSLLDRYVPRSLVDRPKKGFGVPLARWLRGPLRDWAEDLLRPEALSEGGILEPSEIRLIWERHLAGEGHYSYMLWDVLMFQAWRQRWQ